MKAVIIGLCIFIGIIIVWAVASTAHDTSNKAGIKVSATTDDSSINITNDNGFPWKNVTLSINSTGESGFKATMAVVDPGETWRVGMMEFTNGSGERFNPLTHKAQKLYVMCDTEKGHGFWTGSR